MKLDWLDWKDNDERKSRKEAIKANGLIFYRYDGYENIDVTEYVCIRETPCSYWIVPKDYIEDKAKLIRKNSERSYAYLTKKDSLLSYKIRKKWQIIHLKRQLKNAEIGLELAEAGEVDVEANYLKLSPKNPFTDLDEEYGYE